MFIIAQVIGIPKVRIGGVNVITLAKIHLVLIFVLPILLIIGLFYVIRKKNKKLIIYYLLTLCLFYYIANLI